MATDAAMRILQSFRDDTVMRAIGVLQRRVEGLAARVEAIPGIPPIDTRSAIAAADPAVTIKAAAPADPEVSSSAKVRVRILPDGRMTREDAARYLGHSPKTLAQWQTKGKGPRVARVGGRRFYFKADLDAFINDA